MISTKESLEIKAIILDNLKKCAPRFEIRKTHFADPESIYRDLFIDGTYISYMELKTDILTEQNIYGTNVTFVPHYALGAYTLRRMFTEMSQAVQTISKNMFINADTTYLKCLLAHDYLARTIEYDYNFNSDRLQNCYSHSCYGALIKKKCVCQGIADAFQMLLETEGVKCLTISGTADSNTGRENHAWNIVYLQEYRKWTHIDVTWDLCKSSDIRRDYFMLSDERISDYYPTGVDIG